MSILIFNSNRHCEAFPEVTELVEVSKGGTTKKSEKLFTFEK